MVPGRVGRRRVPIELKWKQPVSLEIVLVVSEGIDPVAACVGQVWLHRHLYQVLVVLIVQVLDVDSFLQSDVWAVFGLLGVHLVVAMKSLVVDSVPGLRALPHVVVPNLLELLVRVKRLLMPVVLVSHIPCWTRVHTSTLKKCPVTNSLLSASPFKILYEAFQITIKQKH